MIDARKLMADMHARQDEVFASIRAMKGPAYERALRDASEAFAVAKFSIANSVPEATKELKYLLAACAFRGVAEFATTVQLPVCEGMVREFIIDMKTCTNLMLHYGSSTEEGV